MGLKLQYLMGTLVSNLLVSSDGLMDVPVEIGELIPSMNSPRVVVADPKQIYTKLGSDMPIYLLSMCFVYAPHDRVSRVPVWDAIINRSSRAGPCLVIGDFNLIGELSDKVRGSWPNFEVSNQLHGIKHKLSSCTSNLKRWSQNTFGNNRHKTENLTRDIKIVQTLTHTPSNFYKQRMLLQELETIWLREEMFCHQRSRVNWLKYGDCNSRFFHLYAIQRGQKNKMSGLKNSQEEWIYDNGEIQRLVRDHFGSIFTTNGARNYEEVISDLKPVVSETMNLQLQSPITDSKIHKATKQLEGLKAPGEDGFSGIFYQKYWLLIRNSICKAIRYFFDTGDMLPELNKTLVVLIPKTPAPEALTQFQPISLCNFIYRIIFRVLSNRLKPLMSKIISPQQSAFIPGRQMLLLFNGERSFPLYLQQKKGFGVLWYKWIHACLMTYKLEFIVNGDSIGVIKSQRGLRQGDPISPYLFIIVADVLSRQISKAMALGSLSGIKMDRACLVVSHILFADDFLFLLKASHAECSAITRILD
nr:reverse transcriptase [Tanacetum cinerariifolium]